MFETSWHNFFSRWCNKLKKERVMNCILKVKHNAGQCRILAITKRLIDSVWNLNTPLAHLHNAPYLPPKLLHKHGFQIVLGRLQYPGEMKNKVLRKLFWGGGNKVHYGRCASGVWKNWINHYITPRYLRYLTYFAQLCPSLSFSKRSWRR